MTMMTTNSWITHPRLNPQAHLRLFCFPYAGGGASVFYAWSDDLPRYFEVCPIQLPGREGRLGELPFTRLSSIVPPLVQALQPYLNLPFAFFGHSLGATLSFEVARQLCRRNDPSPIHLFVSGSSAPQIPLRNPPIHQLPETEFKAELRRFNGTPEAVLENEELMQLLLPLLRADFAAHETYVYTADAPLSCPISAFGGLQDTEVSHDDLAAWQEQTRSIFTLRMFPGDHFFLHSARKLLLQSMSQDLTQSLGQSAASPPVTDFDRW